MRWNLIFENRYKDVLIVFFVLLFVSDFLMKFLYVQTDYYFRYSALVKLMLEAYILASIFYKGLYRYKNYLIKILTLVLVFSIGQYFNNSFSIYGIEESFLTGNIYHFNKYVFIILFIATFNNQEKKLEIASQIVKLLILILSVNSVFVILGFLLDINIFKSFPNTLRFGYSGMFTKSGEAVLLYFLVCVFFYLRFLAGHNVFPFLYFLLICILSGKKIAILFFCFFYVFHFCIYYKYYKIFRLLGVISVIIVFIKLESIINFLIGYFPFWKELYKTKGLWGIITSTRNINFLRAYDFMINNWGFMNYLFGGVNYNELKIEVDPFDLFMFFGLVGSFIYLKFIKLLYLDSFKKREFKLLILGYFTISMIYGAFLFNILLMITLYLFIIYFCSFEKDFNSILGNK